MNELYKEEQKLLKELAKSENKPQQNAIKRTIVRLNEDMKKNEA